MSPDDLSMSRAGGGRSVTDVSAVGLKRRKGDFHAARDIVGDALAAATAALDALGAFWGGDEDGHKFYEGTAGHKGYEAATSEIRRHVGNIVEGFTRLGDDVDVSGANIQVADFATIEGLMKTVYAGELSVPTTKAEFA
ncbi:hypothetical protein ACOZ38_34220 [Sphaerisporangium viridialbum]|uniref:hypothetical protein n=1 Tax=Sphaerisporangium viridialbum TaxID=46189 RepID=UPI003C767824